MTRLLNPSKRHRFYKGTASNSNTSAPPSGLAILHGRHNDQWDDVRADIVFIHGLSGHYMKTWTTEDDVCWPRDLLPKVAGQIGVTRTMSFSYESGTHGIKVDLDIEDAAWKLIHGLETERTIPEQRNRPLIFVVHSLGGLVLKKALIISNNVLPIRHILWAVEGIVFLATPHRGSAIADIANKVIRITSVSGAVPRFVKALKLRSPELTTIGEEFRQIVDQRKLPIASFYELHSYKAFSCLNAVVVAKDSAVLHIPSEKLFGAERDHRSIAKYANESDQVFQQIVGCLIDFMKKGPVSSTARVFIPWNSSSHFKGRRDILQRLHETFFPQLQATYQESSVSQRRIVMIYGDSGLGKTEITLKYARENEFRYSYILFTEATSIQVLKNDVSQLHESLGLSESPAHEVHELREFLRQEESWLFIIDNDNGFVALDFLKLPEVGHGHVLITSRSRDSMTDPRISKVIEMPTLEVQEARDLLYSRAGILFADRTRLEDEATFLVTALGCIPAMVENTAAYMVAFQVDIQTCLELMSYRRSRRSILGYHAGSARYKVSAESLFRIHLDGLQRQMPNAYLVLSTLVWLDRTKTTKAFFERATGARRRWAQNGEPEDRGPGCSFVPERFVEMVKSPEFDVAMTNLKHSSLIARDEVFDNTAGGKGSFVLHPSLYQYVRDAAGQDEAIKIIYPALTLVAHAHPVFQAGLEKSIPLKRQMAYQVQQCVRNLEEVGLLDCELLRKAIYSFWGGSGIQFCETMAEILLEAIGNYGEDDDLDNKLITINEALLKESRSIFLLTRLWSKRIPLEYFKHRRLYEGCAAADKFLESLDQETDRNAWTNKDNAEVGSLRVIVAEFRPSEPGLGPREEWQKRVEFIESWQPLSPQDASTLEQYVVGLGVRMRGKLAKDFGLFREAYYGLKEFSERYAYCGSREEGWAIGDFGQLVLELEGTEYGAEILVDLTDTGTNFGERVSLMEGMPPCELTAHVLSRAIESRRLDRGYFTQTSWEDVTESDTMWLEIMHALTLVHQCNHAPDKYADAERELLGLSARFRRIEAVGSWYEVQVRHFAVKCGLAQVSHLQHDWTKAQYRWSEVVQYGENNVRDWKGEHYYIEVARYSLADAQCSSGMPVRGVLKDLSGTLKIVNGKRYQEMLGMGSFWLDFVHEHMKPRIEALGRLGDGDSTDDQLVAPSMLMREL